MLGRCLGSAKRQTKAGRQIKRLGFSRARAVTRKRPRLQPVPVVFSGVVDEDRRRVRLRRAVLQILIEERLEDVSPELQRGVAFPPEWAERVAVVVHAAVPPE